jgi:hypothetical protein
MSIEISLYPELLGDIKVRVRRAQRKAALSANAEMILMYWDIGRMIAARQKQEGWGAGVIPRLAVDLKNELPEEKGFSERNIKRMLRFYQEYSQLPAKVPQAAALLEMVPQAVAPLGEVFPILPQAVAKMDPAEMPTVFQRYLAQLPWGQNILLFEKIKHLPPPLHPQKPRCHRRHLHRRSQQRPRELEQRRSCHRIRPRRKSTRRPRQRGRDAWRSALHARASDAVT